MYIAKEREYFFPIDLIDAALKRDLTLPLLNNMVRRSTRITHPLANRRYEGWIFMVEGDRVTAFGCLADEPKVKCKSCYDTRRVRTFDECERCQGKGCRYCDEGLVPSAIPCPTCSVV